MRVPPAVQGTSAGQAAPTAGYFWLHFPKCGTSFQSAFFGALCDRISSEDMALSLPSAKTMQRLKVPSHGASIFEADSLCISAGGQSRCYSRNETTFVRSKNDRLTTLSAELRHRLKYFDSYATDVRSSGEKLGAVYACAEGVLSPRQSKKHRPHIRENNAGGVAAMFREPLQRSASAFHFVDSQRGRCCMYDWGFVGSQRAVVARMPGAGGTFSLRDWSLLPGAQGCFARMLTGHKCMDPVAVDHTLYADAVRAVREDLVFVGLQELYNSSVCLWYATVGDPTHPPEPSSFANTRPTSMPGTPETAPGSPIAHRASSTGSSIKSGYDTSSMAPDPADAAVYAAAREVFLVNARRLWGSPIMRNCCKHFAMGCRDIWNLGGHEHG